MRLPIRRWKKTLSALGFQVLETSEKQRRRRRTAQRAHQPRFEPLEPRQLLTTTVIDDGDVGFAETNFDYLPNPSNPGFETDWHRNKANDGAGEASWTFSGLSSGDYLVSATWQHDGSLARASDAPYTFEDGVGTQLATATGNQTLAPDDHTESGADWEDLTTVTVTGDTLVVKLNESPGATGQVIADAVRIERLGGELNNPPVFVDQTMSVAENSADGTLVGTLTATDADDDSLTYSIATNVDPDGDGNEAFRIEGDQLLVNDADDFDYETNPQLVITAEASDGSLSDGATVTVDLTAVNEAPVISLPGAQSVDQDGSLVFSNANGNPFSLADVDAATSKVGMRIESLFGYFTLPTTTGLVFYFGSENGESSITFAGKLEAINTALDGLVYEPFAGYSGPDFISVTSHDLGNSGAGGAQMSYATLDVTVNPVADTNVIILDNGDDGFTQSGFTYLSNSLAASAYDGDNHNMRGGEGTATWTFDNLEEGEYRVAATWAHKYGNRYNAPDAPFTLRDGETQRSQVLVDQQNVPAEFTDQEVSWDTLDTITVTSGTLRVELSEAPGNNYVVADAIRIERIGDVSRGLSVVIADDSVSEADGAAATTATVTRSGATSGDLVVSLASDDVSEAAVPSSVTILDGQSSASFEIAAVDDSDADGTQTVTVTASATGFTSGTDSVDVTDDEVATVFILDNGDDGFTQSGFTYLSNSLAASAYDGDNHNMRGGEGTATWTFDGLESGEYEVAATWAHKYGNRYNAPDAPFTLRDGETQRSQVLVDQKNSPAEFTDAEGTTWDTLDTITVTSGTLRVELSEAPGNNYVVADAIRIERIAGSPPTATDDTYAVNEDNVLSGNVITDDTGNGLDTDPDGGGLSIVASSTVDPQHGLLSLNSDGSFSYTPAADFAGSDSFGYEVIDVEGFTATANVQITINPVNDVPTTIGIDDVTVDLNAEDTTIDLAAVFDDAEDLDSELHFSIHDNSNLAIFNSVSITGSTLTIDYTPDLIGTADIVVRATDSGGRSVDTEFTVTVNSVTDPADWVFEVPDNGKLRFTWNDNAGNINTFGIFKVDSPNGDLVTGQGTLAPGDDGYREAALERAEQLFRPRDPENTPANPYIFEGYDAGQNYSMFLVVNGTLQQVKDLSDSDRFQPKKTPYMWFAFHEANSDGMAHFRNDPNSEDTDPEDTNYIIGVEDISSNPDFDNSSDRSYDDFLFAFAMDNTPTTTGIEDVLVRKDAPPTEIDLYAAFEDFEDADSELLFTYSATNEDIFESIVLDEGNGTLTLTYKADTTGSSDITVTATDTGDLSVDFTFWVDVNTPPTTIGIDDVTVDLDAEDTVIDLSAFFADNEHSSDQLTYEILPSSDLSIFEDASITGHILTIDYSDVLIGSTDITIQATDPGRLNTTATFAVTVNSTMDNSKAVLQVPTASSQSSDIGTSDIGTSEIGTSGITTSGTITINWTQQAGFNNSFGIFYVDDKEGHIGTLAPGDAPYREKALERAQQLFRPHDTNAPNPFISKTGPDGEPHPPGQYYSMFLVTEGTLQEVKDNSSDRFKPGGQPYMWFAFHEANPDGMEHFRIDTVAGSPDHKFSIEDVSDNTHFDNSSDMDFNDLELTIAKSSLLDIDVDSDNNDEAGVPDRSGKEDLIEDTGSGKWIATHREGNRYVPMVVALNDRNLNFGYDTITFSVNNNTAKLAIYDADAHQTPDAISLGTAKSLSDLGFSSSTLTKTFYVRADQIGQTSISGKIERYSGSEPNQTDTVLFTAIDDSISCIPCFAGIDLTHQGQLLDVTSEGGGTDRSKSQREGTEFGGATEILLTGNAIVVQEAGQQRVYDFRKGPGAETYSLSESPRTDLPVDYHLTKSGGNYVETDPHGTVRTFAGNPGEILSVDRVGPRDETWIRDPDTDLLQKIVTTVGDGSQQTLTFSRDLDGRVTQQDNILDDKLVRSVSYEYYAAGEANGAKGEVKTAQVYEGTYDSVSEEVTQTNLLETKYYRYYDQGDANGYRGAYKYIFSDLALQRMTGDGIAWQTADDTVVAAYADDYFEYDDQGRVTVRTTAAAGCSACAGGLGQFTYTYAINDSLTVNDDLNLWRNKTEETKPDGTVETTYFNYRGQTLLTDTLADGLNHLTHNTYDTNGNLTAAAQPSAVQSYDDAQNDLGVVLAASSGLIYVSEYSTSTTAQEYPDGSHPASGGDVKGYLRRSGVQNGSAGDPIWQSERTYVQKTTNGITNYYTYESTLYENESVAQPLTTTTRYEFFTAPEVSGPMVKVIETLRPIVSAAENGSGLEEIDAVAFDIYGRTVWSRDADGFLTYTEYDEATSSVIKHISDVDTTRPATFDSTYLPGDWGTLPGGGLHLSSTMEVDLLGRTNRMTDPDGVITYTVYNDANREVRTYGGWDAVSGTSLLPTQISRHDRTDNYYESLSVSTAPAVDAEGLPTGGEVIVSSGIESLSRQRMNSAGQVTEQDRYYSLADVDYSTDPNIPDRELGIEGTHFLRSDTYYDSRGRVARSEDSAGTIVRTVFDGLDRAIGTWTGTNDTPETDHWSPTNPADMLQRMGYEYDDGGVGDGNVTESKTIFDDGTDDFYLTEHLYDFRNRRIGSRGPDGVAADLVFDNLGQVTGQSTYADLDGDFELDPGELRAKTESSFDDQRRVYERTSYEVDQSDGTVGAGLTSNVWYNHRGYQVKSASPNGLFGKTLYDGAGRAVTSFSSIDDDETAWSDALDAAGDTVIEQSDTIYDGYRAVVGLSFARLEDDASSTGLLDGSNSYPSVSVTWYDIANRVTHAATFGRDDGPTTYYVLDANGMVIDTDGNGIPDEAEGAPREPNQSSDWIASKTEYDAAGRAYRTLDNLGRITETQFDLLGRTTATISNYVDGWDSADTDTDQTVAYVYDSAGRLSELVAKNGTEDQITRYLYESPHNGSWQTAVIYPDSSDFDSSGTDQVQTTFDRLGRKVTTTDQRGVEHSFSYDTAGRLSADAVTLSSLPTSVDGTISRLERSYDDVGRVEHITSYGRNELGEFVANQVEYGYNGYGLVSETKQEHDGAVDGSTLSVKYTYDDGAANGEAKYVRLTEVEYPDGRDVYYIYPSSGIGDALSRVEAIAGDASGATRFAEYAYLGAGTIVSVAHPAVSGGLTLDYNPSGDADGNPNGNYSGWDRFGRVVDQRWTDGAGTADLDRYSYTYDGNSNRTSRTNLVETNGVLDEDYTYDGLNRLVDTNRNGTDLQSWNLDSLGNWSSFTDEGTTEERTFNEANELLTSDTRVNPLYDAAGNMISGPRPDDPLVRQHYIYDAWNRLVEVRADNPDNSGSPGDAIATFEYDGRNFRIGKTVGVVLEAFYYNEGQQLLETQVDGEATEEYVWDLRYIDAPILRATPGEVLYYANDANMNVTALVDAATGLVVERYHYDPYGQVQFMEADWTPRAASAFDNAVLYTGRRLDAETGLFYYRARYYDVTLGRFINRDPIGYVDGPNVYQYVGGNATNYVDPSGQIIANPLLALYHTFFHRDLKANWDQGAGPLHHTHHVLKMTVCIPKSGSATDAEGLRREIYGHLKKFDLFNEGRNNIASVAKVGNIAYFDLFGWPGGLSDYLAGNDEPVAVRLSYNDGSYEVRGQTLDDHQLVGVRRWQVKEPEDNKNGTYTVEIVTESYERGRSWLNAQGLQIDAAAQLEVWEHYLGNIYDHYRKTYQAKLLDQKAIEGTSVNKGLQAINPWGPKNQHIPSLPNSMPVPYFYFPGI